MDAIFTEINHCRGCADRGNCSRDEVIACLCDDYIGSTPWDFGGEDRVYGNEFDIFEEESARHDHAVRMFADAWDYVPF